MGALSKGCLLVRPSHECLCPLATASICGSYLPQPCKASLEQRHLQAHA